MSLIASKYELFQKQVDSITCASAIKGTQISKIRKLDEAFIKTGIQLMVEEVLMTFGALEKVSEAEIMKIVSKVLTSYWWLKLEEVAYVFNKGKNLYYGKVFGVPNEATFIDWLNQYDSFERGNQIEQENKDLKEGNNIGSKLSDEQLKELYSGKNVNAPAKPDSSRRVNVETKEEFDQRKIKQAGYELFREQYIKSKKQI